MIKDAIIRIVLLLLVLTAVVLVNDNVSADFWKLNGVDVTVRRGGMMGGMSRFMAQVNWMRLLQFRAARISSKPDKAVAEALYRRYDVVTNQDPYLTMAYEHGGLELATMGQPELSLKLLDKGIEVLGDGTWKLPHYAAHVSTFYLKDSKQAEKYLKLARKSRGHPFFIESSLVRISGKKAGDDPLAMAKLWKEVCRGKGAGEWELSPDRMIEYGGEMDESGYYEHARKRVIGLLREVRAKAAKATGAEKAQLVKKAVQIEKILRSMMPSSHVCTYCFAEYKAGDKFCNNCGRMVKVYGVCPKCGEVADGKYCRHCGAKTSPSKPAGKPVRSKK